LDIAGSAVPPQPPEYTVTGKKDVTACRGTPLPLIGAVCTAVTSVAQNAQQAAGIRKNRGQLAFRLGPAEQLLSRLSGKIDIGESADFV